MLNSEVALILEHKLQASNQKGVAPVRSSRVGPFHHRDEVARSPLPNNGPRALPTQQLSQGLRVRQSGQAV